MVSITSAVLPLAVLFVVVFASPEINCPAVKQAIIDHCENGSRCFVPACNGLEYAAVQCNGSWCFCVLPDGYQLSDYGWKNGTQHRDCVSTTINCPADKKAAIDNCEDGSGCYVPACSDKEYAAVQCRESRCFCVFPDGKQLGEYAWEYGTPSSYCDCARAKAKGEKVLCASNGGFLA